MGFVFSGVFWGAFVILIGVGIIINVLFDVHIPFGRIIFAMLFIGIGISVLARGFGTPKGKDVIFNSSSTSYSKEVNEYNVVFGKNRVDFSGKSVEENTRVDLNCVFGDCEVKFDESQAIKVQISSAFAGAMTPDGNTIAFGEYTYTSPAYDPDKPYILLKANVVFGALHFFTKEAPRDKEEK